MKILYSIALMVNISILHANTDNRALICVPVADLYGSPLDTTFPALGKTIAERYRTMPYCGASEKGGLSCPRMHQLLFNEVVTIVTQDKEQVCVTIPHLFYVTAANPQPQNTYWTLKTNIVRFCDIQSADPEKNIPPSIEFKKTSQPTPSKTVTLLQPWYEPVHYQIFSAGTRFTYNTSTEKHYSCLILNPKKQIFEVSLIPKSLCLVTENKSPEDALKAFVATVRSWAHPSRGFIPYVWGGCSYCSVTSTAQYDEIILKLSKDTTTSFYDRKGTHNSIKTGFDCAGLIARAAQLCGIPYHYKNTLTLSLRLEPLTSKGQLQEGDLIWIPGHVMVISNIKKNLLIEARSYAHGYGIVHEVPLDRVFKGITSYDQLIDFFFKKKPLVRLDAFGKSAEAIAHYKILKMASVWKKQPD